MEMQGQRGGRPDLIASRLAKVRTKRELEALFRYLRIRPSRKLGQNFMVDHNLLEFLVRAAEVGPHDLVVDIGTGTGLLTKHLAEAAGKVIGMELDRRLHAIASRYLAECPNVELLRGDALHSKHKMASSLIDAIRRGLDGGAFSALKLVANLPYSVASLIVPNLLECDLPFALMVVMVQKEVAERMTAEPDSASFGGLSLICQAHADTQIVRMVPPSVFWPRPKVESAVLKLVPRSDYLDRMTDYAQFVAVVRAAFIHRRKTLANALAASHAFGAHQPISHALSACRIEPTARPQEVGLDGYIALSNALKQETT